MVGRNDPTFGIGAERDPGSLGGVWDRVQQLDFEILGDLDAVGGRGGV